jgi:hypothetical protein
VVSFAAAFATAFAANFSHHFTTALMAVPHVQNENTLTTPHTNHNHHLTHLSLVLMSLPLRSFPLIAIPISYKSHATGTIPIQKSATSLAAYRLPFQSANADHHCHVPITA